MLGVGGPGGPEFGFGLAGGGLTEGMLGSPPALVGAEPGGSVGAEPGGSEGAEPVGSVCPGLVGTVSPGPAPQPEQPTVTNTARTAAKMTLALTVISAYRRVVLLQALSIGVSTLHS